MKTEEIKKMVRDRYAEVAQQKSSCCGPAPSCCGPTLQTEILSKRIGYKEEEIQEPCVKKNNIKVSYILK